MFDKIYTTEELTKILEIEQMACVNGQRTFPMPDNAEEIALGLKLMFVLLVTSSIGSPVLFIS